VTFFLSFRSDPRAGSVLRDPHLLAGDALVESPRLKALGAFPVESIAGRHLVLATHGFNVNYEAGVHSLGRLEQALNLPGTFTFIGVLWPGDWWIPVINYPVEAGDAAQCGRNLARFVNASLAPASSVSLVSHSLGARVVLEAVKHLDRPAREVCVLAAAADDDCLTSPQYDAARLNSNRISVLASRGDLVLRLAYPAGDFFSDLFYDDDSPTHRALGYHGPHPHPKERTLHAQIPGDAYGHGDYLPPSRLEDPIDKQAKPIRWVSEALAGLPHGWP
jgi:hypothetical protein